MNARSGELPLVGRSDDVLATEVAAGTATSVRVLLGPEDGVAHFALRRFTMARGGGMPLHRNRVEHGQYVLRGRARVRIGAQAHEVGPDDVLYIPAGMPHSYEVLEAPFEFLCAIPNLPDRVEVLEEG